VKETLTENPNISIRKNFEISTKVKTIKGSFKAPQNYNYKKILVKILNKKYL
jgi:hypothetical protein